MPEKKIISRTFEESISIIELLDGKQKKDGKGKPSLTFKVGWSWHQDAQSFRWIRQLVDRTNNIYKKIVITSEGKIIKNQNHKLSDHQGHGSAKRQK